MRQLAHALPYVASELQTCTRGSAYIVLLLASVHYRKHLQLSVMFWPSHHIV